MLRRLVCSVLFIYIGLAAFGQRTLEAKRSAFLDPSSPEVLVASHRATHNRYPENSLKAIEESIRLGVDIIEIDVKVSKDGIPFLMHDGKLDRTTTGKGDPESFSWEELQQFFIVDKGRRTSLRIPSLEEALELADGKILVDLDLKTDRIDKVIQIVKKTQTKEIVFFFDSDYAILTKVRQADRDFMIMPRAHSLAQVDSAILLFDPPVIHIDFSFYTAECVKLIKSSYARIWINALGDPDKDIKEGREKKALKKLLSGGANIIQTDEPELLLRALEKEGVHGESTILFSK